MEARLFPAGTVPEWTTPEWYAGREAAPHLEQEGHRERLLLSAELANDAVDRVVREGIGDPFVLDLGAGDGGLLSLVRAAYALGFDLQPSNVDAARTRGMDVTLRDVVSDSPQFAGVDLVLATEMLEHLVDPHAYVRSLADAGPRFLVASSPYTETADSAYEFHTWCWDLDGYRALLENNGWRVLRQETAWISQVLLAERAA